LLGKGFTSLRSILILVLYTSNNSAPKFSTEHWYGQRIKCYSSRICCRRLPPLFGHRGGLRNAIYESISQTDTYIVVRKNAYSLADHFSSSLLYLRLCIMLYGVDLILTDFDHAIDVSTEVSPCVFPVGTIPYIAPEMMMHGSNDYSVDIWSAAITIVVRSLMIFLGI
jgi:serine/threonine protein kinase